MLMMEKIDFSAFTDKILLSNECKKCEEYKIQELVRNESFLHFEFFFSKNMVGAV